MDAFPTSDIVFTSLLEASSEFVLVVDDEGRVLKASSSWQSCFGIVTWLTELLEEGSVARFIGALSRKVPWKRMVHFDVRNQEGTFLRLAFSRTRIASSSGFCNLLIGRDIENEQELLSRVIDLRHTHQRTSADLRRLANTDPLTGVSNRREVWRNARWIWAHAQTATVTLVDIDKFKRINDVYGHEAGDMVIQAVADALTRSVGAGAVLGRWGGEEFVAVFEGDATDRADHMVQACRAIKLDSAPPSFKVTVSVGMAIAPDTTITIADAVSAADAAMYIAKEAGGDRGVIRHLQSRNTSIPENNSDRRTIRAWKQ
jgi:diguanylate cyclase (GGDEF)-like protein